MTLFSLLSDDAAIFLRWVHVVAVIVWVGSAFALLRLDFAMRPRAGDQRPQSLLLHAGAGFRFFRAEDADATENPVDFKWEAYAAWASGFALLCVVFCAAPDLYLIDTAVWDAPGWAAVTVAIGSLPLVWLAYDYLCKKSGLAGDALVGALFVFSAVLGLALTHIFAGRAAYLLLGANLATLMAANIAHAIAPAHKRRLASLRAGEPADPADAKLAATRAQHNQYLALPVVFFMLSGHAPLLFAGPWNGVAAAFFLASGFVTRRFFLKAYRGLGRDWKLAAAAGACLLIGFWLSAPRERPGEKAAARDAGQAIAFALRPGLAEARAIVEQNCIGCHSAAPAHQHLAHAAAGLDFSAPGVVEKHREAILRAAVFSRAMPPPGAAKPLDEDERLTLLRWAQSGN
jgi:uncharacterized membrane protein